MKKNIAIISGGNSSEYDISIQSGENIYYNIDKEKYNVFSVHLKGNDWRVTNGEFSGNQIDKNDFSFNHQNNKIKFDCALIAIHGTPGEDGILQAYFQLLNVPYTTCGVLSSSLTFDKYTCNAYLRSHGVLTAKSIVIRADDEYDVEKIAHEIGFPCFVKPNNGGSSCGTSKAKNSSELGSAIVKAFHEDYGVIIEQFIEGTEVTCGLFKNKKEMVIFPLVEIVSKKEFFDYEAKYDPDLSEEISPARISDEIAGKIRKIAGQIYHDLNCRGVVRADFIIKGNDAYFLEVNTVPGMTKNSIVPKMIKSGGFEMKDFLDLIIENSLIK